MSGIRNRTLQQQHPPHPSLYHSQFHLHHHLRTSIRHCTFPVPLLYHKLFSAVIATATVSSDGVVTVTAADSKQKQYLLQKQLQELLLLRWDGAFSTISCEGTVIVAVADSKQIQWLWQKQLQELLLLRLQGLFRWPEAVSGITAPSPATATIPAPVTSPFTISYTSPSPHQYPSLPISCTFTVSATYTEQCQTLKMFPVKELWQLLLLIRNRYSISNGNSYRNFYC